MQRLNRSAPAPRGVVFFLFLGLAIVPFSLRAAGVQVNFSPSLSAAADAWQQIADVFGSGYQPARAFDSPTPAEGREPLRAFDSSACPNREFTCAREVNELPTTVDIVSKVLAPQACATRRVCPRVTARASAVPVVIEQNITAAASREGFQTYLRALGTLKAAKFEAVTHGSLLRNDALLKDVERQIVKQGLAIPESLMMLVRVKSLAVPSATKAAQCKVRAALDSVRSIERERAALTSLSATNPDNCEL